MNKLSGIYKITNNITGDFYIGSSTNIKRRWSQHKSYSTWKSRPGMKLYQAFIKYGLDNFSFEIIEESSNLHEREQYYIEQLQPSYNDRRAKLTKSELITNNKEWYMSHREERLAKQKELYMLHREEHIAQTKAYNNRLCFYNGETLTLNALKKRFIKQGIKHPCIEARKYLKNNKE